MPLTQDHLTLYLNGALIDRALYIGSLFAPALENARIYGLDEKSRKQHESLGILLAQYLQEMATGSEEPHFSVQTHQQLEKDLTGCAFAIYVPGDNAVTFLYFKNCTLALPPGVTPTQETGATEMFTMYTSRHLNLNEDFHPPCPVNKVWLPTYPR